MARSGSHRSERAAIVFVAALAVVMAYGIEAMLPAFGVLDDEFGFSERGLSVSLMVTTLFVGIAAGQLIWGPLSDRIGRRPALIAGLGVFALGAVGTAVAPTLELLLVARLVWGVGAGAPNGLRLAVARDLFDGDQLARVVTVAMAVFLIGPILMPFVGTALLEIGPWPIIPLVAVGLAVGVALWMLWFGETLSAERRAQAPRVSLGSGIVLVLRTPASLGAIAATTCFSASLYTYLGSTQPILDDIYGRGDQFVWFFGFTGVVMSMALMANSRLVPRIGAARMAVGTATGFVALGVLFLVPTVMANGVPSVWVWFAWVCSANTMGVLTASTGSALALDPMRENTGVAASILVFIQIGIGSLLAAVVDSRIDATVTPMLLGALALGGTGLLVLRWSLAPGTKRRTAGPEGPAVTPTSGGSSIRR